MKKSEVVKSKQEFNQIINTCPYIKNEFFTLYKKKRDVSIPHFGLAISKKVGTAVERNKLKRQTRAIVDELKQNFKNDCDYIIMIKKGCKNKPYKEMKSALENLIKENKQ